MIKRFFSSQLVSGSLIVTLGTGLAGGINYLFHLLMGRMLGPADYGVLASLISLAYLLSIPTATLNLVLVKFVSNFKGKNNFASIASLFKISSKKILPWALSLLLIFLLFSPLVVSFLHLPSFLPFVFVLLLFFVSVFITINRAFLQGLARFSYFSLSSILENLLKLLVAVVLVWWGFKVNGALFAFLVGSILAYFFTFIPLRFIFSKKEKQTLLNRKEFIYFALPVFFSTLAFTSLYTTDVVLVRHFFPGSESGFYAALSVLGKIIFFVTSPIVSVAFPLISERYVKGARYRHLLWFSFLIMGTLSFLATLMYFLFPQLMIKILYGTAFLSISPYLGCFGIFLSLYGLCFLMTNFFLSIGKTKIVSLPLIASLSQITLICFFHQDLWQIIFISISLLALLLIGLLLYYWGNNKKF